MNHLILNIAPQHALEKKAFYLRLAQAIINSIQQGQVKPAEKLPTARLLAEQLQVNRHTVMRAYAELIAQGWVENFERSHYQVSSTLPIFIHPIHNTQPAKITQGAQNQAVPVKDDEDDNKGQQFAWDIQKTIHTSNFIKSTGHFKYSFAGGQPDHDLFPFDEYRGHINDALKNPSADKLNYGHNQGDTLLIEQGLTYLRRSRNIHNKQLMITNGSQEALYLVSQLLLKKGANVAVESFGYPPAWHAFRSAGANLIAIKQDSQGLCTEHLEELAQHNQLTCIYLTPLHQYPTTVTLSTARRLEIYRIAKDYNLFLIEDDYDHEFHYACQPLAPMAASDDANLVIYLASFSKIMFPAARAGMLVIPNALLEPLVHLRTTINHKPPALLQEALGRWMASPGFERHIRRCTKAYQLRYQNAQLQIQKAQHLGANLHCLIPDGGMALWIKTSIDTQQLAQRLALHSIYIQHQNEFCYTQFHIAVETDTNHQVAEHKTTAAQHFRLGFAGQSIEKFNAGFTKIIDVVLVMQNENSI